MRPAGKRPKTALARGGGSLDAILTGVTSLHSSVKPLPRPGRGDADTYDVAALQGFLRDAPRGAAGPPVPPGQVVPCHNLECPGRGEKPSFEEDKRKGDRICLHCGATSRLRPEEEEHRSFADDDGKSEKRKRAEQQQPGRSGGRVGDRNLARVSMMANSTAEGESDLGEKDQRRLAAYKERISALTSHAFAQARTGISRQVIDAALNLAEQLVRSQAEHDKRCSNASSGAKCRLAQKPKNHAVVAAGLIMHAERLHESTHQFQEIALLLQGDLSSKNVNMAEVGKITKLIDDLLRHGGIKRKIDGGFGMYPCAAEIDYQLQGGVITGALSDGGASASGADAGARSMMQHKAVLPKLCGGLRLHYMVQRRAGQILDRWLTDGLRAMKPQTAAACAVHYAHEESKRLFAKANSGGEVPALSLDALALQAGIETETIRRALKELTAPKPEEDEDESAGDH